MFLGSRVVVLTPRPGRIALDLPIDLPRTGIEPDELRGLPDYAALRAEIGQPCAPPSTRLEGVSAMTAPSDRLAAGLDRSARLRRRWSRPGPRGRHRRRVAALRAALVDRKVLFFRDQRLDDDGQVALGRRLGELTASHPVVGGVDVAHPEVYALDSADNGFADVWHTDVTFMKRPPLGSILRAVTLPPTGGDTNWADASSPTTRCRAGPASWPTS